MKQITAMKKSIAFMTIQAYYLTHLKLQWFWLVHLNKGGFILKLIVKLLIVTFLLTTTGFVYGQTKNDNSSKSDTSSIQAPDEEDSKEGDIQEDLKPQGVSPDDIFHFSKSMGLYKVAHKNFETFYV